LIHVNILRKNKRHDVEVSKVNKEQLLDKFTEVFQQTGDIFTFFAPGRVNLIGEHTDYNGGHVFPCALDIGTYAIAQKREDQKVKLFSLNFESQGVIETTLHDLNYDRNHNWANYPIGILKTFQNEGYKFYSGFDVLYYGNIPNGAGLSSSASIELVTSTLVNKLYKLNVEMLDQVKISHKSENEFIGVNCGIMDQFIIGMGKKDHAILLNTNTLKFDYVPLKLENISIVIANTNKRRGLADSKYNERRNECEQALIDLQSKLKISSLGELTEEQFEENKLLIKDEVERKRVKHVVYENYRTMKAVQALRENNIGLFGELMNQSHISLKDDYEVTGIELDTLVNAAWENGAIGSRMTGAGFGGCTVSLVNDNHLEEFIQKVGEKYKREIGYEADFYIVSIDDGAREIR